MKGKNQKSKRSDSLRKQAEEFLNKTPSTTKKVPSQDVKKLVEELRIYQVELEIQNEELRRAQLELQESRDRFSDLYDFAPIGYLTIGVEGLIQEANLTGATMLGVERRKLIGQPFSRFITKNTQEIFYLHRQKLIETRTRQNFELRFVKKDGREFWAQLECVAVEDELGNIKCFRGVLTNIDNRKRPEAIFMEGEKHLRDIFEATENVSFILTDADEKNPNILKFSPGAERMFGFAREEAIGKPVAMLNIPKDVASFPDTIESFRHNKTGFSEEFTLVRKSGEKFQALFTTYPVFDDEGNLTGALGVSIDISDRVKAEEALRESQEIYGNIISESPVGISIYDASGQCLEANDSLAKIIGTTKEQVLKQNYNNIESWKQSAFLDKAKSAVKDQSIERHDLAVESTFGKGVKLDAYLVPFSSGGLLLMVNDITERRKLEEERLKVEKLESLGVLAGGIAHDFNNILTTIMGNLSYAKMGKDRDSETYEVLEEAEKASFRAKDLTLQLLTFAKGGAPVKETASLSEVIRESGNFVLKGSNVRCDFAIPEDIWPTDIDVGQISQITQNLIINADQAMPDGGVIKIKMENRLIEVKDALPLPDGKYIQVTIRDQGVGIPEKHLSKIFDPYFSTKDKGSGLGLATTLSIIRKHGGHITVDSEMGTGTVFNIYLAASEKGMGEAKAQEGQLK